MPEQNEASFEINDLKTECLKLVIEHFRDKKHPATEVDYALRGLAVVGRLKATERIGDATQLAVLRYLTDDKKQLKKYIEVSLPHLNPMAQLPEK